MKFQQRAFPTSTHLPGESKLHLLGGLTKREWFVGQALVGVIARPDDGPMAYKVSIAFEIADEVMKLLEPKNV